MAAGAPAPPRPQLMRIPFSHYCRKVEWALVTAGIPYDALDIGIGKAPQAKRVFAGGTVPVLRTQEGVIGGSAAILHWIDAHRAPGTPNLYPPDLAPAVRAWEAWADETVGPVARREAYRQLYADPKPFRGYGVPWWIWTPARRRVVLLVMKYYKSRRFDDRDPQAAADIIAHVASHLNDDGYLFTDRPTAADLATAALLEPLVQVATARGHDALAGMSAVRAFVDRVRPIAAAPVKHRRMRKADWHRWEQEAYPNG